MTTNIAYAHTLLHRTNVHLTDLHAALDDALADGHGHRSITSLAALAREGARIEGERSVIREVAHVVGDHGQDEVTIEAILWAALGAASSGPHTSRIDAEEYAEGQRNALTWIRMNVIPRDI